MKYLATLNKDGRLTIPKVLRDDLNYKPGTKVRITLSGNVIKIERIGNGIKMTRGSKISM